MSSPFRIAPRTAAVFAAACTASAIAGRIAGRRSAPALLVPGEEDGNFDAEFEPEEDLDSN